MAIPTKIAERDDYLRNIAANRGILYFTDVGYVRLAKCDGSDNGRAGYAVYYDLVDNWAYRVRGLGTAYEKWLYGAYPLYKTSETRSESKGYLWPTPTSEDAFRWAKTNAYDIGRCQFFLVGCTEQELRNAGISSAFRSLCMGQKVYSNVSSGEEVEYRVLRRTPDAHMIVVRDTIRNEERLMSATWDFRLEPAKKLKPGSVIMTTDLARAPWKPVDARPIGVALPPDASAWVNSQGTPGSCYGASLRRVLGCAGEDIEEGELVTIQDVNKDTGLPTIVAVREDKPKDAWVPKVGDWVKVTKPKDSNDAFSGWVKKMDHLDGKVVLLQADASKYGGRKLCVVDLKAESHGFQWNIRPEWCQKVEATQKDRDSTLFLYDGKPYRLATKDDVGKQAIVGFLVSEAVNDARHKTARIRKLLSVPDIQYRNDGERSGLSLFESEDNGMPMRWTYAWVDATEKTWKPKVGDWVKVTKPKDENEAPGWLPYMDRFDGKVMQVREVPSTRHSWYKLGEEAITGAHLSYALDWLSPAEAPKEPKKPELPEGTATAAFIERLDCDPIELAGPIKVINVKCVLDNKSEGYLKAWFDLVGKKQVAIVPLDSLKASLAEKEPAQIPGIPEGFRPVEVRKVKKGEWYLDVATQYPKASQYGKEPNSAEESMFLYLILEPIDKKD